MPCYNDITYCVRQCSNTQCKRNIKHLERIDIKVPLSQAYFEDCEKWRVEE